MIIYFPEETTAGLPFHLLFFFYLAVLHIEQGDERGKKIDSRKIDPKLCFPA
jgi:hypothetical protein